VQKELLNVVPENPEFSLMDRASARVRTVQDKVSRFMKDHKISWF
jgi:hypothetical protein